MLHGKPGTGKSMISLLLCNDLLKTKSKVSYVDTFNPTDPGDSFVSLYNKILPTIESPMVLVFEECDRIVLKLHSELIQPHKHQPIQIKNKSDWNLFFDRFDRKMYPGVIIILTTNKSAHWFDEMDSSYIRERRVNHKFEITSL